MDLSLIEAIRQHHLTTETFIGMIGAALMFLIWEFTWGFAKYKADDQLVSSADQWWLIIMSAMVVAGSVYCMGAWQNDLRDSLEISMTGATVIGAMTFMGNVAGFLGGLLFDRLGPKAAVSVGSCLISIGYCLIAIALLTGLSSTAKTFLAGLGSLLAGYAAVSLMDNIVCMACSISFPQNRAAVVGYLKAVLATAGGLWALLWVQVFRSQYGLVPFLAVTAIASFLVGVASLSSIKVLPPVTTEPFQGGSARAFFLIFFLTVLTCFDVSAGYRYSQGSVSSGMQTGIIAVALQMSPLLLLATVTNSNGSAHCDAPDRPSSPVKKGLSLKSACFGMDFWLLWSSQFAVFGAGVAVNQNLALILETTGHDSASSFGVALFALTSALSRVVVGILSDKYQAYFTRFHWLTAAGLALAALIIVCELMPTVYRNAAGGKDDVCEGPGCYRPSFFVLTVLNAIGLASTLALQAGPY
eukprot:Skav233841  [mRNA]  locus=scaffold3130:30715:38615:- [translate_table: standard]